MKSIWANFWNSFGFICNISFVHFNFETFNEKSSNNLFLTDLMANVVIVSFLISLLFLCSAFKDNYIIYVFVCFISFRAEFFATLKHFSAVYDPWKMCLYCELRIYINKNRRQLQCKLQVKMPKQYEQQSKEIAAKTIWCSIGLNLLGNLFGPVYVSHHICFAFAMPYRPSARANAISFDIVWFCSSWIKE